MATGDPLLQLSAQASSPPATLGAQFDVIVGTSTPVEYFPVLAFDAGTIEYADFHGLVLPSNYGGGGITIYLKWSSTQTTNATVWGAAIRRIQDDAEDLDTTAHTYDYNDVTATTASAAGEVDYTSIAFTSGADMDSLAAEEAFSIRIRRNATSGSDNMTGDAYLHSLYIEET